MGTRTKAIAAVVLVAGLVGSHWFAYQAGNTYGRNAVSLAEREEDIKSLNQARAQEQKYQARLELAVKEAHEREAIYRNDADAAERAAGRLRNTVSAIQRSIPDLTDQAVRRYADAASVVFQECTDRYRTLAEQADRIDSDRQTLEAAWPKQ